MTTMIRYQPWALHRALLDDFNRDFNRDFNSAFGAAETAADEPATVAADWSPAVDIDETAEHFVLRADVPGVEPASIELTLEKGVLTLSGARAKPAAAEGVTTRHAERRAGRFERRFTLPDTVDAEAITAKNSQGVLEVLIPKRPKTQPRRITVTH